MLQRNREVKGCWGSTQFIHEIPVSIGRVRFNTCVGNAVRDGWHHWVEMHRQFQNGVLPYSGSLSDQPAKVLDIFKAITSFNELKSKEMARDRHSNRQRGKKRG